MTGRVAAFNRLVSRATDKCLPFFKTLKKAFEWTERMTKILQRDEGILYIPTSLSPSKPSEELSFYLIVSPMVVSLALIREEDHVQLPVYYTSQVLWGTKGTYPPMEKLAFTLITSTCKLRPYFQAYIIMVQTDKPLLKAMNKPEAAKQLVL